MHIFRPFPLRDSACVPNRYKNARRITKGAEKPEMLAAGDTFINENSSFILEIGETTNRRHGGIVKH